MRSGATLVSPPNAQEICREAYAELRREVRQILAEGGVPSNPGWNDMDILASVSRLLEQRDFETSPDPLRGGDGGTDFLDSYGRFRADLAKAICIAICGPEESTRSNVLAGLLSSSSDTSFVSAIRDLMGSGA